MLPISRILGTGALLALVSCSGGGGSGIEDRPLNLDYSTLRIAESRGTPLQYASHDEQLLISLRNGVRLMTRTSPAQSIAAVSPDISEWNLPMLPIAALVAQPDRTTLQLLDVRDPQNVSQSWRLQIDGGLDATRLIGDTLYLVTSYRPRVPGLVLPADTHATREANERLIRSSTAAQLLPHYSENGGVQRSLVPSRGCLIAQEITRNEGYTDLLVISAINVRTRKITDVNCLSTNVNGVYMTRNSLYVAGTMTGQNAATLTVLHKFALGDGEMSYRATGSIIGTVGWANPSYFVDEHDADLRVLSSGQLVHRLTRFDGLIQTAGYSSSTHPPYAFPERAILHDDEVFAVHGDEYLAKRRQDVRP